VSFKHSLTDEISVSSPKPNSVEFTINIRVYNEMYQNSTITNKKDLLCRLNSNKGDISVYCEPLNKFFIVTLGEGKLKARDPKSREEKELVGALINGIIVNEHKKGNAQSVKSLCEIKLGWELPPIVYRVKDERGKAISVKELG